MQKTLKNIIGATGLMAMALTPISAQAADGEYIKAETLLQAMDSNNLWCFGADAYCDWVDTYDIKDGDTASIATNQWYREAKQPHNFMSVRFTNLELNQNFLCDLKSVANQTYSTHYYINAHHRWLDVDKIPELLKHSDDHLEGTLSYHNENLACYGYKDKGIDKDGYQTYEQFIFFDGLDGKPDPVTDTFRVIPKDQAKILFIKQL